MTAFAPSAALEILKPITWFAPMWAFMCGVVSSGAPLQGRWLFVAGGVALAGPLVCGTSQAVNDWYDRHVDAINEPHRPIPSGRLPGETGFWIAIAATIASLVVAALLGLTVLVIAIVALAMAWAYSAPAAAAQEQRLVRQFRRRPLLRRLALVHRRRRDDRRVSRLADRAGGAALQRRRARHHDAERLQVRRRRPEARAGLPARATGRRQAPRASPAG